MATTSNANAGRRTLTLSLVIGVVGTVANVLLLRGFVSPPKSIWLVVALFLAAGLIGLTAAVIALVRGRAIIRWMAIPGLMLNGWLTLFGLIGLFVAVVVGPAFSSFT